MHKSSTVKQSLNNILPFAYMKSQTKSMVKSPKNTKFKQTVVNSEQGFDLKLNIESSNTTAKKNSKIKQSQAKSEWGSVLPPCMKSSNTIAKK